MPLSCNLETFDFLEPSGPLQACNGTALPLPRTIQLKFRSFLNVLTINGAKKKSESCGHKGTVVALWLRRCATNQKVAGSIPDGVIGIFH